MIKGSLQQVNTTIIKTYVPNIKAHKYVKKTLSNLKGGQQYNSKTLQYPIYNKEQKIQTENQ